MPFAQLLLDLTELVMSLLFFKNYTSSQSVTFHILFKYNLITFKAIKFSQPTYLSSLIKTSCLTCGNRLSLSSVSHKKAIGRRGIAMASLTEWKRLPQSVRSQTHNNRFPKPAKDLFVQTSISSTIVHLLGRR